MVSTQIKVNYKNQHYQQVLNLYVQDSGIVLIKLTRLSGWLFEMIMTRFQSLDNAVD